MLKKNVYNQLFFEKSLDSLTIKVPELLVDKLIHFFISKKKKDLLMNGFEKGTVPEYYIKQHFAASLSHHLEHILYYFYAQDIFVSQLRALGMYIPKEFIIEKELDIASAKVIFKYEYFQKLLNCSLLPELKKMKFPERKKYKDLDRQAYLMIEAEQKNEILLERRIIQENDWIGIVVFLADNNNKIFDEQLRVKLWIQITSEGIDREIRKIFLHKTIGDQIICEAFFLHEMLSTDFLTHSYVIIIEDHISHLFFSFQEFEKTFSYENKSIAEKIIDVFSLRNDISLKKEKSQLSLKHFLEKIKISIAPYIIEEHEEIIKHKIIKNSDYLLYQSDVNFLSNIKKLACRQAMEKVLVDYLIHFYDISLDEGNVHCYLNILQRHRLRDFLYFDIAHVYDNTVKSMPIFNITMEQMVLREKTIEFLISKLQ